MQAEHFFVFVLVGWLVYYRLSFAMYFALHCITGKRCDIIRFCIRCTTIIVINDSLFKRLTSIDKQIDIKALLVRHLTFFMPCIKLPELITKALFFLLFV